MRANLSWRAREPVWRLERPFLNRDVHDERANRRTEHGEQPIYQNQAFLTLTSNITYGFQVLGSSNKIPSTARVV